MTKNPAFGTGIKNLSGENLPPDDLEVIEQVVAKDGSTALIVAWRTCKKEARTETLFFDHPKSQYTPPDPEEYTLQDMKSDAGEDCHENPNNICACVLANATEMPNEPFEEWCDAHHLATGSPGLASSSSRRGPGFALVCFGNGQQLSVKKICYYNCAGSAAAITVPVAYVCPISIQR